MKDYDFIERCGTIALAIASALLAASIVAYHVFGI